MGPSLAIAHQGRIRRRDSKARRASKPRWRWRYDDAGRKKIALVTGASRGVGRGVARELARQGANVVLAARMARAEQITTWGSDGPAVLGSLVETAKLISAEGGRAESIITDLLDPEQIESLVAQVVERWGRIDILVNCAMGFPDSFEGNFWETPIGDWAR